MGPLGLNQSSLERKHDTLVSLHLCRNSGEVRRTPSPLPHPYFCRNKQAQRGTRSLDGNLSFQSHRHSMHGFVVAVLLSPTTLFTADETDDPGLLVWELQRCTQCELLQRVHTALLHVLISHL